MAAEVLNLSISFVGLNKNDLLEQFGGSFFNFCINSGYQTILKSIGQDLRCFFNSLDSLHEHLTTKYPGMRPPSFRVLDGPQNGTFILRYISERIGLEYFVIGAAKAAAQFLFDLDVEIIPRITPNGADYLEFLITPNPSIDSNLNEINFIDDPTDKNGFEYQAELETVMDPLTFCQAFPFHVIFDRELVICQAGVSLVRVIPDLEPGSSKFSAVFFVVRPHIPVTFESILSRQNAVFIVKTREGWMKKPTLHEDGECKSVKGICKDGKNDGNGNGDDDGDNDDDDGPAKDNIFGEDTSLRLKGQMVFLPESDTVLFLCSPRILSLDSLGDKGLKITFVLECGLSND